jgi:hypothetical protein
MNAHSNFAKGRKANRVVRVNSKAFRRGLAEGFSSTASFFAPVAHRRAESIDATVDAAWKAVSSALSSAYETEAKNIGKAADKKLLAD